MRADKFRVGLLCDFLESFIALLFISQAAIIKCYN